MPKVIFVESDGKEKVIDAEVGLSILEVAHKNGIDLEGACEGSLACATCHVILDDDVGIMTTHTDGWPPIPTASMIFNYEEIPHQFNWRYNGKIASANITNLNISLIKSNFKYIPFPPLMEFTGYKDSLTSLLLKN